MTYKYKTNAGIQIVPVYGYICEIHICSTCNTCNGCVKPSCSSTNQLHLPLQVNIFPSPLHHDHVSTGLLVSVGKYPTLEVLLLKLSLTNKKPSLSAQALHTQKLRYTYRIGVNILTSPLHMVQKYASCISSP